jgi:hyperosmotically inducible protein
LRAALVALAIVLAKLGDTGRRSGRSAACNHSWQYTLVCVTVQTVVPGEQMMVRERNQHSRNSMRHFMAVTGLLAGSLVGLQAYGAQHEGAAKDAWIDGKLEAVYALNRYLSAFAIDTAVTQGVVQLTGKVSSDIDRDLAGELAKGIEGVVDVHNNLAVMPRTGDAAATATATAGGERSFGAWIDDATTTASVKSKLLGNPNTEGLQIDVDTRGDVVTLSGEVASAEEKALAEELARNTGDVKDVRNQLVVRKGI